MLKSTHRVAASPSLPPGWTEHKAPSGHSYYYNATTKQSTYTRPSAQSQTFPEASPELSKPLHGPLPVNTFQGVYDAQFSGRAYAGPVLFGNQDMSHRGGGHRGRGDFRGGRGYQDRRRHQPEDRPKSKHAIPGCEPWLLVATKLGRRFVYNSEKNESFWKFPAEVMKGVIEYDRIERERKQRNEQGEESEAEDIAAVGEEDREVAREDQQMAYSPARPREHRTPDEDSDEYEEVEVTDDEDEGVPSKKQKVDHDELDQPVEFGEDDIAYQLAAMGQDYGLDTGEYGDGEGENWEDGAEGLALTVEDSHALFKDMLDDYGISPYSTWEKIIDDGRIVEDDRYTVLTNMKSRKDVWVDWSREKIQTLKEQREKQEKSDPRIPYLAFLQKYASPKLYWPEFRRKYKKEPEMRDNKVSDKDREKWYREHLSRLKLPESTLKFDLSTLLKSIPLHHLNRSTSLAGLPTAILTDIRYISLSPTTRDPLIEAYISTLAAAPDATEISPEEEMEHARRKEDRERREKALAEREKRVQEEKRRQRGALQYSKGILREGEEEIARAMKVGKEGLKSYLEVGRDHGTKPSTSMEENRLEKSFNNQT